MYVFCIRTHFGPCEAGSLSQQAKNKDKNEAFFLAHTTTTSVVTMADPVVTNDALAAAVAAAAEIAKNGGGFLFNTPNVAGVHTETPSALSMMFPTTARQFLEQTPHLLQSQQRNVDESCTHASDEDDDRENDEEDAERRMARSRERNREHARRTRLRKKAQLEALQGKVKGLQAENSVLKQSLEECSIASILVGLSSDSEDNHNSSSGIQHLLQEAITTPDENSKIVKLIGNKRRRFVSDASDMKPAQPLKINIDGQTTLIGGGRTHINWKSGVYSDESGSQRQLTQDQLEGLR